MDNIELRQHKLSLFKIDCGRPFYCGKFVPESDIEDLDSVNRWHEMCPLSGLKNNWVKMLRIDKQGILSVQVNSCVTTDWQGKERVIHYTYKKYKWLWHIKNILKILSTTRSIWNLLDIWWSWTEWKLRYFRSLLL